MLSHRTFACFLAVALFKLLAFASTGHSSPTTFVPFPTNALSCFVRPTEAWGKIEVLITNISSSVQTFSAPRIITTIDMESATNVQVNTLAFQFRYIGGTLTGDYLTFARTNVADTLLSLAPQQGVAVSISLSDVYLSMRDNGVPFDKWFMKGNSKVYLRALLVTDDKSAVSTVVQSNEQPITADERNGEDVGDVGDGDP